MKNFNIPGLMFSMFSLLPQFQTHHHLAVQDEQVRANEAEQELSLTAAQSELRVSSLEANLSELSEVVGRYERLRQQVRTNCMDDIMYQK